MGLQKLVRTIQNYIPVNRNAKEAVVNLLRRTMRVPAETDYRAVRHMPEGCLLLDVGANHGQSILSMRMFAPHARIVSFEPNALLAVKVRHAWRGDPLVRVESFGLSDQGGHFDLFVPSYRGMVYDGLASLDERAACNWMSSDTFYGFNPTKIAVTRMPCEVRRLDDVELPKDPDFIKYDVQGFEYRALMGGLSIIKRSLPVLMIEAPWHDPRIANRLEQIGYIEYRYDGTAFHANQRGHLNSFFINERSPDFSILRS
jgi:FkbM family methyltransferase